MGEEIQGQLGLSGATEGVRRLLKLRLLSVKGFNASTLAQ